MFNPQANPPQPFPMARCNTSMTSSNASFYFPPQHAMQGGLPSQAVPASTYMADAKDPVDMMLAVGLSAMDRNTASRLMIRRLGAGKYEIDGRKVTLRWTDQGGSPSLLVSEDG